jgi:ubiquinone/menaquinone biosynthesis C-methylase UbiE
MNTLNLRKIEEKSLSRKVFVIVIIILAFFFALADLGISLEQQDVLTPESANEARLNRLQPPDQVMDAIGIKPGMTVAEIGAGRGRYVVQIAVRVGETGKVYAEDIDEASLKHLEKRCAKWGLEHVEAIHGDVTDPKLPVGELDVIFVISAYHHFQDPVALMRNARPSLKPDGVVAIGEWLNATSPEQVEAQMKTAGYKLERTETFLEKNNLYIYIFRLDEAYRLR